MDIQQHEQEQNQPPEEQTLRALIDSGEKDANGIPIVRTNTPRPLSFVRSLPASQPAATAEIPLNTTDFPVDVPIAPPLPEEPEEGEQGVSVVAVAASSETASGRAGEDAPEFIWLFEYGLEMDEGYLNSPNRLNDQAHTYGPAVLKGYHIEGIRLRNGRMAISLAKDSSPQREVWGVLYRIPRLLAEQRGSETSLLDTAHATPLFHAVPVVVREIYRKRAVQCVAYLSTGTGRDDFISLPFEGQFDPSYAQRLLEVARQQHLPETYLQTLTTVTGLDVGMPAVPASGIAHEEQNTEPLPVVDVRALPPQAPAQDIQEQLTPRGWLLALSLYLIGVLMAALALAVIQASGYWGQLFTTSFAPLGAPWYVLLYGLLGGCISCIIALGRSIRLTVPGFVVLTWFVRPFLGMVLAALAYLTLSSGVFIISIVPAQRYAICSVAGAIAGLCEGWLFFRRK